MTKSINFNHLRLKHLPRTDLSGLRPEYDHWFDARRETRGANHRPYGGIRGGSTVKSGKDAWPLETS